MSELSRVVADLGYTYGYFPQLSPSLLSFCALSKGVRFHPGHRLRYLELGFGQGVSLAIHTAGNAGEFWGNDINTAHVAHARGLVSAAGASAQLFPDSFEQLCARTDLPQFDVIALHGIWSWVSDQDRARITELARRHLAPGGVLYVSYNCAAGWSAAVALRHLMLLHAEHAAPRDTPVTTKVERALAFAQDLADADAAYFRANPTLVAQLRSVSRKSPTYLAHEFLGAHWRPMSFSEVAEQMGEAGLEFLGTTYLLEHGDRFTLNDAGRRVIETIDHPVLREMAIECFINPQFRQDVFVKRPVALSAQERLEAFRKQRFLLTTPRASVSLTIPGPRAPISLEPSLYGPLLDVLAAQSYAPKTLGEVQSVLREISIESVADAIIVLTGGGYVHPAFDDTDIAAQARTRSRALNAHLCRKAQHSGEITVLASPLLGSGIRVGRAEQLFLAAIAGGADSPKAWAQHAWARLEAAGERLNRQGRPVESSDEAISILTEVALSFETGQLPILRAGAVA